MVQFSEKRLGFVLVMLMFSIGALSASEPCAVHGTVTDLIGEPLRGATVKLVSGQSSTETLTDTTGRYCFKSVASSQVEVRGFFPGFHRGSQEVQVPPDGSIVVDIPLKVGLLHFNPDRFVQGTVRDEEGDGLTDVLVQAICVYSPDLILSARTNEDGEYELNIRQPGQYAIVARQPGRLARSKVLKFKGQPPPQVVDFLLPKLTGE